MATALPPGAPSLEVLFFGTVQDLRQRSHLQASMYEVVQSAGLVRRLLFDQKKLLDSVAQKLPSVSVEFTVGNSWVGLPVSKGQVGWLQGPWLDSELSELNHEHRNLGPADHLVLSLADFATHEVASTSPGHGLAERASVKDLVRLYANHFGGVHVGMEAKPNTLLLEMVEQDEPFVRETMSAVGRTVARTLEPLASLALLAGRPFPMGLEYSVAMDGTSGSSD